MNVSNEQRVAEEAVVRVLRATRANDAEAARTKHPRQTPQCLPIARFAAVRARGANAWTQQEAQHASGCPYCRNLLALFKVAADDLAAAVAHEDTVTGLNTSEETQTGWNVPSAKRPAKGSKPPPLPPNTGE